MQAGEENGTMTRKRLPLVVLVAVLVVLGSVGIRARLVSAAGSQLPLVGSYSGSAAFTGTTTVAFGGKGIATSLGSSANQGYAVITGPDGSCPGGIANINYETLTAANGDSLTITSQDVACPVSPKVLHGTGQWVVTGGTGRFSGATGQGKIDGYSDFNQNTFVFQLTGTISAPNRS
jgi:hypothetical protein